MHATGGHDHSDRRVQQVLHGLLRGHAVGRHDRQRVRRRITPAPGGYSKCCLGSPRSTAAFRKVLVTFVAIRSFLGQFETVARTRGSVLPLSCSKHSARGGRARRSGTPSARAPAAAAQARARHVASAAKTQLIVLAVVARCISPNVLAKGGALVALARATKGALGGLGAGGALLFAGVYPMCYIGPPCGWVSGGSSTPF